MSQTDLSWLRWWNISIILPLIASRALTLLFFFLSVQALSFSAAFFFTLSCVSCVSVSALVSSRVLFFIHLIGDLRKQSAGEIHIFFFFAWRLQHKQVFNFKVTTHGVKLSGRHKIHAALLWFVHLQNLFKLMKKTIVLVIKIIIEHCFCVMCPLGWNWMNLRSFRRGRETTCRCWRSSQPRPMKPTGYITSWAQSRSVRSNMNTFGTQIKISFE